MGCVEIAEIVTAWQKCWTICSFQFSWEVGLYDSSINNHTFKKITWADSCKNWSKPLTVVVSKEGVDFTSPELCLNSTGMILCLCYDIFPV